MDLYELTMAQAYDVERMDQTAVFELIFRKMPGNRNYFVASGLEDVLAYLENLQVTDDDVAWLRRQGLFTELSLDRLKRLRFRSDVYAIEVSDALDRYFESLRRALMPSPLPT